MVNGITLREYKLYSFLTKADEWEDRNYFRHSDQRVLRLVNKSGLRTLTAYLGPFEYHLRKAVTGYTKLALRVSSAGRHAQAERILAGSDPDGLSLFFHRADHLGSGHVLTRDTGDLLSQHQQPDGRKGRRLGRLLIAAAQSRHGWRVNW